MYLICSLNILVKLTWLWHVTFWLVLKLHGSSVCLMSCDSQCPTGPKHAGHGNGIHFVMFGLPRS